MRVLFIYPNFGTGEMPLNLSYLTAIAKNEGAEVRVFDASIYQQFSTRGDAAQTSVGQFKPIEPRPDARIVLRDSDAYQDLDKLVGEFRPDLVCVTSFTNNFKLGLSFLKSIREKFEVRTIFGGVHTTLVPEKVIAEDSVDMICVGEGEGLMKDLCNNVPLGEIGNLWFKKYGIIFKNPMRRLVELDDLPRQDFDDYESFNFFRPLAGKLYKSASVEVSRGCPYKCSYCVNHTLQKLYDGLGHYHRVKSVKKAIDDLVYVKERYGIELFRFWDEDFTTLPIKFLREFSKEYITKLNIPFLIYARVDTISKEKLNILKSMGCITIAMGIESGNQEIREKVLNRHMTDKKIVDSFRMVKESGIRCSAYNMIGLPFETRREIFDTIRLNRICKPDSSSIAFLEPYQNTQIFHTCVDGGYIDEDYVATFDFFNPHIRELMITHKELRGILKTFMLYVKAPKILWPVVRLCEQGNDGLYRFLLKYFSGA